MYTPLQIACMTGNFELVEILLEQGAEPNNPNSRGKTPLIACFIKELPHEYTFEN